MQRIATLQEIQNLDASARQWLIEELRQAPGYVCARTGDLVYVLDDMVLYYFETLFQAGLAYEVLGEPDPSVPEPTWWQKILNFLRPQEEKGPRPQASQYTWSAGNKDIKI